MELFSFGRGFVLADNVVNEFGLTVYSGGDRKRLLSNAQITGIYSSLVAEQ